jgi:hypothetical protein
VLLSERDVGEFNVVLDPEHPDLASIAIGPAIQLEEDPRLAALLAR